MIEEIAKKIRQMLASLGTLSGSAGFKVYGVGAVTGVHITSIVIHEDTEFTSFKITGVEQLTTRGMSGVTFAKGMYLPAGPGQITDFTIASGSIIAY